MTDLFKSLGSVNTLVAVLGAERDRDAQIWQSSYRVGARLIVASAVPVAIWLMWRHGDALDAVTTGAVVLVWALAGLIWLRAPAASLHPADHHHGPWPDVPASAIALPEIAETDDASVPAVEDGLLQAEKMETIGRCVSEFAHDFNNLSTVILYNIDRAAGLAAAGSKAFAYLADATLAAERAVGLVSDILAFSRQEPAASLPVDINHLLVAMRPLILSIASGCVVEFELGCTWQCRVAPNQLENAVLNLVVNARDAMPSGGHLTVQTFEALVESDDATTRAGEYVVLAVSDTGIGMPPKVAACAFEPFFTTKPVGQGTGIGLSQIAGFARRASGSAFIKTAPALGTRVTLFLPRCQPDMP